MSNAFGDNDDPEIEARIRLALARVNRQLSNEEIEAVRGQIARQVVLASRLNAVPLRNSDEPAHEFTPTRGNLDVADQRP